VRRSARLAAIVVGALALAVGRADAQQTPADSARGSSRELLSLRGYTQGRYGGVVHTSGDAECDDCGSASSHETGASVRRARLVLSGDVSDRVAIYIQPELASIFSGLPSLEIRDLYADIALDAAKEFRLRVGQSKLPFGWENMQSSSNRLAFERTTALRSAFSSERDLAAIFYWTPVHVRARLEMLTDSGLKGAGEYGMVALGAFNGAGSSRLDFDRDVHAIARITYPFALRGGRFVELGLQGFSGRFVLPGDLRSSSLTDDPGPISDRRAAASVVLYPQPFGVQAEWTVGRGPSADATTGTVRARPLRGGYVQAMYRHRAGRQLVIPFVRAERFDGGEKFAVDAQRSHVRDLDTGVEWLPFASLELTAMYTIADRRAESIARVSDRRRTHLLQVQAQVNY